MNRYYLRVTALAIFLFVTALSGAASPRKEAESRLDPGERIIRIVKKIKGFVRGFTSQDDSQIPPIPKP